MTKRFAIGKYITNFGILSALAGAISVRKRTRAMLPDWRRIIVWGVWLAGLVLAVASVAMPANNAGDAGADKH